MKYINKISKIVVASASVLLIGGCSLFDLNINTNPNNPLEAAPDLVLTRVEVDLSSTMAGLEGDMETFAGIIGTQATSRFQLSNPSYNGTWSGVYSSTAKDIEGLIDFANKNNAPLYLGVAQILKAYLYGTMVDLFGDIPFSEAAKGDDASQILNPKFDDQAAVYTACLGLLDNAVANLAKASPVAISGDLFYSGNTARWTRLANSLKLKFLMTGRLAVPNAQAQIVALLNAPTTLISGTADDFTFRFSRDATSIRHPWYTGAYTGGEFDYTYINHQIMVEMLEDKDPRFPFYFRRQTKRRLNAADPTDRGTLSPGYIPTNAAYIARLYPNGMTLADSLFVNGLFGRERGDQTGIPADGALRLLPGVYPCGGFYDYPYDVRTVTLGPPAANAAAGGGVFPILTDVNLNYYRVEAALKLGWGTDSIARVALRNAITGHISRVVDFGVATDANAVRPTQAAIDAYVNLWLSRYDAASGADAKLNVAMKSLWFASYGNGFEIFNALRRTGFPTSLTDPGLIVPLSRKFPLRLPYPQIELSLNSSADKYRTVVYDRDPLFWDK